MLPTGRIGDVGIGTCSAHATTQSVVGVFGVGTPTVMNSGAPSLNLAAVAASSCGHSAVPSVVSTTVLDEQSGVHRLSDIGLLPGGVYILSTGDPTRLSGG